jgi:hypothetical protein
MCACDTDKMLCCLKLARNAQQSCAVIVVMIIIISMPCQRSLKRFAFPDEDEVFMQEAKNVCHILKNMQAQESEPPHFFPKALVPGQAFLGNEISFAKCEDGIN